MLVFGGVDLSDSARPGGIWPQAVAAKPFLAALAVMFWETSDTGLAGEPQMLHPVATRRTVDGSELRRSPVEVGSLSPYVQGFLQPRWCRISSINGITLPETNIAPENRPGPTRKVVFQAAIFRCELLVWVRVEVQWFLKENLTWIIFFPLKYKPLFGPVTGRG